MDDSQNETAAVRHDLSTIRQPKYDLSSRQGRARRPLTTLMGISVAVTWWSPACLMNSLPFEPCATNEVLVRPPWMGVTVIPLPSSAATCCVCRRVGWSGRAENGATNATATAVDGYLLRRHPTLKNTRRWRCSGAAVRKHEIPGAPPPPPTHLGRGAAPLPHRRRDRVAGGFGGVVVFGIFVDKGQRAVAVQGGGGAPEVGVQCRHAAAHAVAGEDEDGHLFWVSAVLLNGVSFTVKRLRLKVKAMPLKGFCTGKSEDVIRIGSKKEGCHRTKPRKRYPMVTIYTTEGWF